MKIKLQRPTDDPWIDSLLDSYFTHCLASPASVPSASPEFEQLASVAAQRARDILLMTREQPRAASPLSSLREHFKCLAQLTGVKLDEVFIYLGIRQGNGYDKKSVEGLARLARLLGMEQDDAILRLRIGLGLSSSDAGARDAIGTVLQPGFANLDDSSTEADVESTLRQCEDHYDSRQRNKLQRVTKITNEIFARPSSDFP